MNLYEIFEKLAINYQQIEHEPVTSVAEAQYIKNKIEGIGCKNLFLTDNKHYYLIIIKDNKKANIKRLANLVQTSHLSFASIEQLKNILNLEMGSVTPFGIINDIINQVIILIDCDLKDKKLLFHPDVNTKTIALDYNDLIKFIEYQKHRYIEF